MALLGGAPGRPRLALFALLAYSIYTGVQLRRLARPAPDGSIYFEDSVAGGRDVCISLAFVKLCAAIEFSNPLPSEM